MVCKRAARFALLLAAAAAVVGPAPEALARASAPQAPVRVAQAREQIARAVPVVATTLGPVAEATRDAYVAAADVILRYYHREFGGLPFPLVRLHLYGTTDLFEQGLVELARIPPDLAAAVARSNSALASARSWAVLVDAGRARRLEAQVAHEVMHLMQSGWGERRADRRGPQWLREGMAVYYEGRVEEALGVRPFAALEAAALEALRGRADTLTALPVDMSFDLFVRLNGTLGRARNGWAVLYAWAFVAYAQLAARVPQADVVRFFGVPNVGADLETAFVQAFQIRPAAFEAELKRHLLSLR